MTSFLMHMDGQMKCNNAKRRFPHNQHPASSQQQRQASQPIKTLLFQSRPLCLFVGAPINHLEREQMMTCRLCLTDTSHSRFGRLKETTARREKLCMCVCVWRVFGWCVLFICFYLIFRREFYIFPVNYSQIHISCTISPTKKKSLSLFFFCFFIIYLEGSILFLTL